MRYLETLCSAQCPLVVVVLKFCVLRIQQSSKTGHTPTFKSNRPRPSAKQWRLIRPFRFRSQPGLPAHLTRFGLSKPVDSHTSPRLHSSGPATNPWDSPSVLLFPHLPISSISLMCPPMKTANLTCSNQRERGDMG
jgi:hypothetical protein